MKKILFATTALIATAGLAHAEVSLSGSAEAGIVYNPNGTGDAATGAAKETRIFTDIDVTFKMSGEADNGLTFGASIDLDEATGADQTDAARLPDATIFLAYGPATLTIGDTDSAFDKALSDMGDAGGAGAINDDHTVHPGYFGNSSFDEANGGQEIRFDYALDALTLSVSVADDRTGVFDTSYALGVSYKLDLASAAVTLGLGYISTDAASAAGPQNYDNALGVSAKADFTNGFSGVLTYVAFTDDSSPAQGDGSHIGIGLGYSMNALSISANYGMYDFAGGGDADGYGLAVNYDLGGGLKVQLGVGGGTPVAGTYEDTYSLGLAMSF